MFGLFCKVESEIDPFMQLRDNTTSKAGPLVLPHNNNLEYYTFFYISFEKRLMSTIYNKKASSLEKILTQFLHKEGSLVYLTPLIVDNINSYMGLFRNFTEIECSFSEDNMSNPPFRRIGALSNLDADIGSYKISFKISRVGNGFIDQIGNLDTSEFKTFRIKGKSDESVQNCIDLVEKTFTKRVSITLTDDEISDIAKIKDILRNETLKVIHNHSV